MHACPRKKVLGVRTQGVRYTGWGLMGWEVGGKGVGVQIHFTQPGEGPATGVEVHSTQRLLSGGDNGRTNDAFEMKF